MDISQIKLTNFSLSSFISMMSLKSWLRFPLLSVAPVLLRGFGMNQQVHMLEVVQELPVSGNESLCGGVLKLNEVSLFQSSL